MDGISGSDRRSQVGRGLAVIALSVTLVLAALPAGAQSPPFVTPTKNTNLVGTTPPGEGRIADFSLKQQQEPSCVIRPNNPAYIFCAYNDLRAADRPEVQGDSWIGYSISNDFGQTWFSDFVPGYKGHPTNSLGMGFAADPTVVAIPGNSPGLALVNYIAAFRDSNDGVFAVQRFVEFPREDQDFYKPENRSYLIDLGTEGRFIDKSSFYYIVDEYAQQGTIEEDVYVEGETNPIRVKTPTGTLVAAAAVFTGSGGSKLLLWKSRDNGKTWSNPQKISEEQNEVTGVSIAAKGQDFVVVYRLKGDNNNPHAIMSAFCSNTGNEKCTKGEVVYEICPFDQPASGSTFRSFAFPWAASDGERFWAISTDRNPGGACVESATFPGYFEGKPRVVAMSSVDGKNWVGAPGPDVDKPFEIAPRAAGFQVIPTATGIKGRIDVAWYDTFREEDVGLPAGPNDLLINDYQATSTFARVWRKADVWMTRLDASDCSSTRTAGCLPDIKDPVRVSQYETFADRSGGNLYEIEGHLTGLPLYGSGTLAFKGDYIWITGRPLRKAQGSKWIPNYLPRQSYDLSTYVDKEDVFVAWGDNRDVVADVYPPMLNKTDTVGNPAPNLDPGQQMPYSPPSNSASASALFGKEVDDGEPSGYERPGEMVAEDQPDNDITQPPDIEVCSADGFNDFSSARDANVYGSLVRDQASLVAPTASKPLGTIQRMFPLILTNDDPTNPKDFCLRIENQPLDYSAGTGLASFYQLPSKAPFTQGQEVTLLTVGVGPGSTASRVAFVTTSNALSVVTVNAYAGACPVAGSATPVSSVELSDGALFDPAYCEGWEPVAQGEPGFDDPRNKACVDRGSLVSVKDNLDGTGIETHNITFGGEVLQTQVLETPTFQFPTFQFPTFQFPTFQFPTFQFPTFQFPTFQFPTFQFPTFQFSGLSDSDIAALEADLADDGVPTSFTYLTDAVEAPTLETSTPDTFQSVALAGNQPVYYQDISFPVKAAANVTTTYSADVKIDEELDRDTSAVQLIAWTPNVHATTNQCKAQPTADQQIIAYTELDDASLESFALPFAETADVGGQDPYRGSLSFFGQSGKEIILTLRIWAVDKEDPDDLTYKSAYDTIRDREEARQTCLADPANDTLEEIAACEDLGTRGLVTFGASSHSCITRVADEKTDGEFQGVLGEDCLDNGTEKLVEDKTKAQVTLEFTNDDSDPVQPGLQFEASGPAGIVVGYTATATDDIDPDPVLDCQPPSGETFGIAADGGPGAGNIVCYALDDAGNQTIASFPFSVVDTTPPTVTAPDDVTFAATGPKTTVPIGMATATDLVDTDVLITNDAPTTFPVNQTTVTWRATDRSGNTATATQLVTVEDRDAPVFPALPAITKTSTEASLVVNYGPITAKDDVDGPVTASCVPVTGTAFSVLGSPHTVDCTATDLAGNSASASFTITIEDTGPPSIIASSIPPDPLDVEANDPRGWVWTLPLEPLFDVRFNDTVYGEINADCRITGTDTTVTGTSSFPYGDTAVTCDATDSAGNLSAAESFTVTVADNTDPEISNFPGGFNPDLTSYVLQPDSTTFTIVWGPFDANDAGDSALDVSCAVTAGPAPTGPVTGPTQPLYTFSYNFPAGTTVITCKAIDTAGNETTATFTRTIEDNTPPVIVLAGDNPQYVDFPGSYTEAGIVEASDQGGLVDLTAGVVIDSSAVVVTALGNYPVTYTVSDGFNTTVVTRSVIVRDIAAPTLSLPADIAVEATGPGGAVVTYSVSASDNTGISPEVLCSRASGDPFSLGTTTVTCTATDASGNSTTGSFNVLVQDTSAPSITAPADVTAEATGQLTSVVIGTATATDVVDTDVTITNDAPATFPVGTTVVTWTATDDSGNSVTQTQNVTVTPTITVSDITISSTENFGRTPQPSIEVDYLSGISATDADPSPTLTCSIVGAANDDDIQDNTPSTGVARISAYGTWQVSCTATYSTTPAITVTATFNINVVFPYGINLIVPKGNGLRAGSTVPIDWSYLDEFGNPIPSSSITPTVSWTGPYMSSNCSGTTDNTGTGEDAGSSSIRLTNEELLWQFSWQTPDQVGSYVLEISPPGAELPEDIPTNFELPAGTECVMLR